MAGRFDIHILRSLFSKEMMIQKTDTGTLNVNSFFHLRFLRRRDLTSDCPSFNGNWPPARSVK